MLVELGKLSPAELDARVQDSTFRRDLRDLRKQAQIHILNFICQERIDCLSVAGKSAVIKALGKGPTWKHFERSIRDIFLHTTGPDLTRLKRSVDRCDDHRDLTHLLYHDVDVSEFREDILQHFLEQARLYPCWEVRVICDVDDTLYSNWSDTRYPAKAVYPGIFQLLRELDSHGDGAELGDIVFLTGRVGERGGFLKTHYRKSFAALGAENFSVITGSLFHQFYRPWIFARKWYNLQRHRKLFPEMKMVLFGDSGQADPEFLCQALDHYPDDIKAAFLNHIRPVDGKRFQACQQRGVVFCDTYVSAAAHLCRLGLLDVAALRRIVETAKVQMAKIPFADKATQQARENELNRDIQAAGSLLEGEAP